MNRSHFIFTCPSRVAILCFLACSALVSVAQAQVPVFKIVQEESSIKFSVKASVALEGTFDKWDATLVFTSPNATTGVLDVKIQADSVNTGSGMKDGKLKSKEFFDVQNYPTITYVSNKIVPTGPNAYEVNGIFTIRGV